MVVIACSLLTRSWLRGGGPLGKRGQCGFATQLNADLIVDETNNKNGSETMYIGIGGLILLIILLVILL
ncbi:MAG TPA: hypothetical protein VHN55_06775 [Sphingomicrobium sp.]|nr:hypothetical protein [Sphingomicrobium sp.]